MKSLGIGIAFLLALAVSSLAQSLDPNKQIKYLGTTYAEGYPGHDICAKIDAAVRAKPGYIIDARSITGQQSCSSNPLANTTADLVLYLGDVTINTTAPWVSMSNFNFRLEGLGRGNGFGLGTTIMAATGFPATCDGLTNGCPVLRLGNGSTAFGHRIENVSLDCHSFAGCIGLYSTDINEQSGAYHFSVSNFSNIGVFMDGSGANSSGPFFAQNFILEDGEVYALDSSNATTIGLKLIGSPPLGASAPRLINGITSSGSVAHPIPIAYLIDSWWGGAITNINAENALIGYKFADTFAVQSVTASNLRCFTPAAAECILINAVPPFTNNLVLMGIQNVSTPPPVTIQDFMVPGGLAVTDPEIGLYIVGNGFNTGGGTRFSTTTSVPSVLNGLTLRNNANVPNGFIVDSGQTAASGSSVALSDRGTPMWTIQNTSLNEFQIFDHAHLLSRLFFNAGGGVFLSSFGANPIGFNETVNSGTGGVSFCSGGATPTCPAGIDAGGNFSGASGFFSAFSSLGNVVHNSAGFQVATGDISGCGAMTAFVSECVVNLTFPFSEPDLLYTVTGCLAQNSTFALIPANTGGFQANTFQLGFFIGLTATVNTGTVSCDVTHR